MNSSSLHVDEEEHWQMTGGATVSFGKTHDNMHEFLLIFHHIL
jgi:hypothetical protein